VLNKKQPFEENTLFILNNFKIIPSQVFSPYQKCFLYSNYFDRRLAFFNFNLNNVCNYSNILSLKHNN